MKNFIKKNKIIIAIILAGIILGGFILINQVTKQKSIEKQQQIDLQTKIAQDQLTQLKIQNDLKQEELDRDSIKQQELKQQESDSKKCYAERLAIIYPYYGYNDNAFKLCLSFIQDGSFTFDQCQQKQKDRVKELDNMWQQARIDCGLK